MERVQQVVEKAKVGTATFDVKRPSVNASINDSINESHKITPLHEMRYSQTRTVHCNAKTLLNNRVLCDLQPEKVISCYNLLRTQVLQTMRNRGWNSLAIVSPNDGEGKTLTAVNLAIAIAKEVNQTVLLADYDLQNPQIDRYFGFEVERGISDYIQFGTPINEILVNPGTERLVILPGKGSMANSSETLLSPRMVQLTEEIKSRYPSRIIIFDLPPILSKDDAVAFSPYVDAFLLVFEEGRTTREDILYTSALIKDKPVIGTLLNKV